MYELSPPESVHALDREKLRKPDITFWSAWEGSVLLGCGALKVTAFRPAQALYESFGFSYCGPFGGYQEDPNNVFMTIRLDTQP